ncbi:MAG: ABC transporter substrate-binding protein [Acidobacteriota bacterium]|nr:ABC transporter substrate-binding protein [Acidobacteriota bacterium]
MADRTPHTGRGEAAATAFSRWACSRGTGSRGTRSRRAVSASVLLVCAALTSCRETKPRAGEVVVILESSPNNLDLRQGTDAQSERVGSLVFDALVKKDEHFALRPWLATSWEQPDPLTWIFHLRPGVRFHDGRPLEAEDVVWTIESLIDSHRTAVLPGGALVSAKSGSFAAVDHAEAQDPLTVVVHMKRPDAGLLFNMSDGLFGVVPRGAGREFGLNPVGSGPYRFVRQVQDQEVVLERFADCWSTAPANGGATAAGSQIQRLRFSVVPDTITSALEMQKGSGDIASNVLTPDMVHALEGAPGLGIESGPGSSVWYLNFNAQDHALGDKRVRQAVAYSLDRPAIIAALWRGRAQIARGLLPEQHWAAASDAETAQYPHDTARAQALLDAAGFHPGADGVRLTLTLKTSTDETTRLLAAVMQQQMRASGIALKIRSAEFGTFYSDVTKGAFQMYVLKWVGSNEDPDIFRYMYASASFPPRGANRGRYVNPQVDALLTRAASEAGDPRDVEVRRRAEYVQIQKIVAEELPSLPLWFPQNRILHSRRMRGVHNEPDGSYDYLRDGRVIEP